jgi:hypothetical protein
MLSLAHRFKQLMYCVLDCMIGQFKIQGRIPVSSTGQVAVFFSSVRQIRAFSRGEVTGRKVCICTLTGHLQIDRR